MASNVNYEDATPIPDATVPTAANVDQLAILVARWLRTKMYGADVRESLARWVEITTAVMKLYDDDIETHKNTVSKQVADVTARQTDVEQRQTTTEQAVTDAAKEMTDAAAAGSDGYAAEVIAARDSELYGSFATLDARLEALEAAVAPHVADASTTATIPVGLGRQVPISVSYYEYALGAEPDGLGSGPYGLGGSAPLAVSAIATTWPDADTASVALPIIYKDIVASGVVTAMADGSWTMTSGYKTLRFVADK